MDSNLLTVSHVAEKYGVHRLTVFRLLKAKQFTANKFGHKWLIDKQSLEAYLDSCSNQVLVPNQSE